EALGEHAGDGARLLDALARDVSMEVAEEDLARALVLDAREQRSQYSERGGHDAARRARVHALREHLDREHAVDDAAQRGRRPQVLVVRAAGVEADDETRRADARG